MSYSSRHHASTGANNTTTVHSSTGSLRQPPSQSLLQTRINAKRAELENLGQLRDLSANLANQLGALERKLGTLRDGAQSVALVLANWDNVLRAISMAAMKVSGPSTDEPETEGNHVDADVDADMTEDNPNQPKAMTPPTQQLPVPLVRIPLPPKAEDGG